MADLIRLEVVTPEKEVFSTMVESFVFPSVMGNTGAVSYTHLAIRRPHHHAGFIVTDGLYSSNGFRSTLQHLYQWRFRRRPLSDIHIN